ncbi:hypothetical protein HDU98_010721 [Podochytrium sp. JEL0797]|nr:hypothetical protein HDU98_010721 [Podochytrium sp. JEL0797]
MSDQKESLLPSPDTATEEVYEQSLDLLPVSFSTALSAGVLVDSLLPSPNPEPERAPETSLIRYILSFTAGLATGFLVSTLLNGQFQLDHMFHALTCLACARFFRTGRYLDSLLLTQLPMLVGGLIRGHGLVDLLRLMPSAYFNIPVIVFTVLVQHAYKKEAAQFMQKHAQMIDLLICAGFGYLLGLSGLAPVPERWQNVCLVYLLPIYVVVIFVNVAAESLKFFAGGVGLYCVWMGARSVWMRVKSTWRTTSGKSVEGGGE